MDSAGSEGGETCCTLPVGVFPCLFDFRLKAAGVGGDRAGPSVARYSDVTAKRLRSCMLGWTRFWFCSFDLCAECCFCDDGKVVRFAESRVGRAVGRFGGSRIDETA